jgi:AcrR family transcriptional regulator
MGHNADMGTGLRERKKAMTRRALQDAALDLFTRQGFEHTTVDEIAAACDVSPRTFFRYFATKEDVLFGDGDDRRRELIETLEQRPPGEPPMRSMREAILALTSHYEHDRARLVAKTEIMTRNPTLRSRGVERQRDWEAAVTETLLRREPAAERGASMLGLHLVAGVATAALRAACDTWVAEGGELRPLVVEAFDQLGAGLDTGSATSPAR